MIRCRTLGQCAFEVDDQRVTPEAAILFALLLLLTRIPGQAVSRAEIVDMLWPDCDPPSAHHRLRQALYQLRKRGISIRATESSFSVSASDVEVDHSGHHSRRAVVDALTEFRRVDYLPDYTPTFSLRFARWVEWERDRIGARVRTALLQIAIDAREKGEYERAIELGRACLDLDAFNEEAAVIVGECLALSGSRQEAVEFLDRFSTARSGTDSSRTSIQTLRRRLKDSSRTTLPLRLDTLVGREETIRHVDGWIRRRGRTENTLALVGEAGIGKTRLLAEATAIFAVCGIRAIQHRASPNGEERSLAGLLDMLPLLLSTPGAVGCAPGAYRRLTLLAGDGQLEPTIPTNTQDSELRFATLRRCVLDLFDAILAESELVLCIDDVHSVDRPTMEILLTAVDRFPLRLSLLLAMRPEGSTATFLTACGGVSHVRLDGLTEDAARLVLTRSMSIERVAASRATIDWAVDLANGNPFFLVELAAHCCRHDASESLPDSLHMALKRKLDALSPTALILLQACTALAQHSTLGRLEALLELPPHATAAALAELERGGFVSSRDGWLGCRHDLIADAVGRDMGLASKRFLYRRCATVLEHELGSAPAPTLAWQCAYHWHAAGEHERAFELTCRIADQLVSLGLPTASAELCRKAERYSLTPAHHAERLWRLTRALKLLEDWTGVIEAVEQRRALLGHRHASDSHFSDDEFALLEAKWRSSYDGALLQPMLRQARNVKSPTVHRLRMAVMGLIVADNHQRRSDALRIAKVLETIAPTSDAERAEYARAQLIYNTAFGRLEIAVKASHQLVAIERAAGESAGLIRTLRWAALPRTYCADSDSALSLLGEAYEKATYMGVPTEQWHAAACLTEYAIEHERGDLATQWASTCRDLAQGDNTPKDKRYIAQYFLARAALLQGDIAAARKHFEIGRPWGEGVLRTRGLETSLALDTVIRTKTPNESIESSVVAELHRLHLTTRASGVRDFETGALLFGLILTGQSRLAKKVCDAYFTRYRRTRGPLPTVLREARELLSRAEGS